MYEYMVLPFHSIVAWGIHGSQVAENNVFSSNFSKLFWHLSLLGLDLNYICLLPIQTDFNDKPTNFNWINAIIIVGLLSWDSWCVYCQFKEAMAQWSNCEFICCPSCWPHAILAINVYFPNCDWACIVVQVLYHLFYIFKFLLVPVVLLKIDLLMFGWHRSACRLLLHKCLCFFTFL